MAVEHFVFEEDDGIGIADRGLEQALVIGGREWRDHLQTRDLRVPGRIILAVLGRDAGGSAVRPAEYDRATHLAAGHIERLGGGVDDLVDRLHRKIEGHGRVLALERNTAGIRELPAFDLFFPVLHGPNGEDGTVQGALELCDVAYVGSRVMGSAASMDKDVAKRLMRDAGLPVVPYVAMSAMSSLTYDDAIGAVGSPEVFVKPANMGSSVGVSKARTAEEFEACCRLAVRFDRKILIERCVAPVREIECSVLEDANGNIRASQLGEIVPADKHGFYSYDAKYLDDDGAALQVPANVPPAVADRIKELAIKTFRVLGCEGMARVDFFLNGEQVFVNEANTLPGFTNISMYPRLWEASGLPQSDLMDVLIGHALERHKVSRNLAFQRE